MGKEQHRTVNVEKEDIVQHQTGRRHFQQILMHLEVRYIFVDEADFISEMAEPIVYRSDCFLFMVIIARSVSREGKGCVKLLETFCISFYQLSHTIVARLC